MVLLSLHHRKTNRCRLTEQIQRSMDKEDNRMDNMEKVEKLRERANVTYEEAKAALEESSWDLLDAIVNLERQGKKSPDRPASPPAMKNRTSIIRSGDPCRGMTGRNRAREKCGRRFGNSYGSAGRILSM